MEETMHLLASRVNAARLIESIAQMGVGVANEPDFVEPAQRAGPQGTTAEFLTRPAGGQTGGTLAATLDKVSERAAEPGDEPPEGRAIRR